MNDYHCIVIGSGQGGIPLNNHFARQGQKVVTFERDRLGGSCVNYGCTPSKTLLASAHTAAQVRQAASLGITCDNMVVDFPAVMRRVRDVREKWRSGVNKTKDVENHDVVMAEARFVEPHVVEADGQKYTAQRIVIDTGTRPRIPDIPGLSDVDYLTSDNIFELNQLPRRLLVIGAGTIGCELGQAMAMLGSEVTFIEKDGHVLPKESPHLAEILRDAFDNSGCVVHCACDVKSICQQGHEITATLDNDQQLKFDAVLVAVGRSPNLEALNLEAAGIETDRRGFILVDEYLRTAANNVYAIGEVAGQPAFTHVAYEDHRRVLANMESPQRKRDDRVLSYAIFTEPQVGRCGMNAQQAEQAGYDIETLSRDLASTARGVEWGYAHGHAEIIIDQATDKLLGATLVCHEAGELVQMFIPAIQHGLTRQQLSETMPIHPTFGEALHSLIRG